MQRPCGGPGRGRQVKRDEASQEGGFRPRALQDFGSYAKKKVTRVFQGRYFSFDSVKINVPYFVGL